MTKKNLNKWQIIQILALKAVEDPSFEDIFRRIQRWYSHQYHVPINQIDSISDEELLQAWFEEQFLALKNNENEALRQEYENLKKSIIFQEEYRSLLEQIEAEDEAFLEQLRKEQQDQKKEIEKTESTQSSMIFNDSNEEKIELKNIDDPFYIDPSEFDE